MVRVHHAAGLRRYHVRPALLDWITMYTVSVRPPGYGWKSHGFGEYSEAMAFAKKVLAERGADLDRHGREMTFHEDGFVIAVWVKE